MKAKDLIKLLEENPDAEVVVTTDNFEQGQSKISLEHVSKWKMKKVNKRFVDAFDHESYHSDVYEISENGQEVFVL